MSARPRAVLALCAIGAVCAVCALAACGADAGNEAPAGDAGSEPTPVVVVTLTTRATTLPPSALHVSFTNDGTTIVRDFPVEAGLSFPRTLSVTAPGRSGELAVEVLAQDGTGATVARGRNTVVLDPEQQVDLAVVLEPEDFVVNARTPASQLLARNADLAGRQTAVRSDGSSMLVWETDCASATSCNVYARRLDARGRPVGSGDAAASDDFVANRLVQVARDPAVAASDAGYLVTWAGSASATTEFDIRATLLDPAGGIVADDVAVSTDPATEGSATPFALADGSFLVVWARARSDGGTDLVARRISADGAMGGTVVVAAAELGTRTRPHGIGLPKGNFALTWLHLEPNGASNVYVRLYGPNGAPLSNVAAFTDYVSATASGARAIATSDGGFAIAWQAFDPGDPTLARRPVLLRLVDDAGNVGDEIRVAESSAQAPQVVPALGVRASDGALAVAWTDSGSAGDGNGLGVRYRLFGATGAPCGDAAIAASTVAGDQFEASLAANGDAFLIGWTDASRVAPDTDGSSVRARFVYPALCP
jgi:hypothetical protein